MNQGMTRRCFIAIPVDDVVRDDLCEMMDGVEIRGMRRVLRENLHVTVKFLGEIDSECIGLVIESLAEVVKGVDCFELNVRELTWLPNARRARILAAGLDMPNMLPRLVEKIENAMGDVGFGREGRMYRAHVTLGRFSRAVRGRELIAQIPDTGFVADSIVLMESELGPGGAVYSELGRFIFE